MQASDRFTGEHFPYINNGGGNRMKITSVGYGLATIVLSSLILSGCVSVGMSYPASYGKQQTEAKSGFVITYCDIDSMQAKRISGTITASMAFYRENFADVDLRKFTVYIYHTQEDLVRGLVAYSGFSQSNAQRFSRSGAPRPLSGSFHVPISMDARTIAHETTHMFIESVSGSAYQRAKWIDEGLAEYMSYLYWKKDSPDAAVTGKTNEYNAFLSQNRDRLFPLDRLCAESQWSALNTGSTASLIYREAFLVVAMLVRQHGLGKLKLALIAVRDGMTPEAACQMVFSRSQVEILSDLMKLEMVNGIL
jgi:hypothetical protein